MSQAKGQTDTSLQELVRQQIQFNEMTIRTILLDGVVWFIATDVCAALQIKKPNRALARLEDYEKGAHTVSTPGGEQKVLIINEAELYSLILTSRKPEAKAFKCWLTTEVLPSIRKTGRYDIHQEQALPGSEAQESVLREVFNDFGHWRVDVLPSQGQKLHIYKMELDTIRDEIDQLEACSMAFILLNIRAELDKVKIVNVSQQDPLKSSVIEYLDQAVQYGTNLARRFLYLQDYRKANGQPLKSGRPHHSKKHH